MKNIFKLVSSIVVIGMLASCVEDGLPGETMPYLHLASTSTVVQVDEDGLGADVTFPAEGGTVEIEISSDAEWTVDAGDGQWCAIFIDGTVLKIVASENEEALGRIANFKVTASNYAGTVSANIVILQNIPGEPTGTDISYTLQGEDTEIVLPAAGGSYRVEVASSEEWIAVPESNWFSLEQDDEGFTLTAGENNVIGIRSGQVSISAGDGGEENTVVLSVTQSTSAAAMIIEVNVGAGTSNEYTLPIDGRHESNCLVYWGDGDVSSVSSGSPSHQYSAPGVYDIAIYGNVTSLRNTSSEENSACVTAILQWGNIGLERMGNAFDGCINLRSVAAPDEESFALLVDAEACFSNCTSLESIPEGLFAGTQLIYAEDLFNGCTSLREAPARLFEGCSQVESFSNVFDGCSSLTNIAQDVFKGCDAANTFSYAFRGTGITSVPEGLFQDCISADRMTYLFANCTFLTTVSENVFAGLEYVTQFAYVFDGCSNLASVPSGIFDVFRKRLVLENLSGIFKNCASLKEIPGDVFTGLTSVTNLSYAFQGCTQISTLPDGLFDGLTSVTYLSQTFNDCTSLKNVPGNIFSGMTSLKGLNWAFDGCSALETIPEGLFSGLGTVTTMNSLFANCSSLKNVPAGIFDDMTAVNSMTSLFTGCSSLESIPEGLFAGQTAVKSLSSVFNGCASLKSVPSDIFNGMTAVANLSKLFMDCTSLTSVPEGIFAGMSKVSNCNAAFMGCTSLESVPVSVFDDCVKVTNFGDTFSGCTALTGESPYSEIEGVKYHLYERGDSDVFSAVKTTAGCFEGCTRLTDYSTIAESYPGWL